MEILKKDAKTGEVLEKICFVNGDEVEYELVKQNRIAGVENYDLFFDDHCFLIKIGVKQMHLSENLCLWIANNYNHLDFNNHEVVGELEDVV